MDLNQLFHHHQMALMAVSKSRRDGEAAPDFELPRYYAKRINEYRELRGLNGDAHVTTRMSESNAGAISSPAAARETAMESIGDERVAALPVSGRVVYGSTGLGGVFLAEAAIDDAAQCAIWECEGGRCRASGLDEEEGIARTYVEQYIVGQYRYSNIVDAKAAARRRREAVRTPEGDGA